MRKNKLDDHHVILRSLPAGRRSSDGSWAMNKEPMLRTGRVCEALIDLTAKSFSLLRMDPATRSLGDRYVATLLTMTDEVANIYYE
jgi:hypothetical protein